jgi:hypothetical protein
MLVNQEINSKFWLKLLCQNHLRNLDRVVRLMDLKQGACKNVHLLNWVGKVEWEALHGMFASRREVIRHEGGI